MKTKIDYEKVKEIYLNIQENSFFSKEFIEFAKMNDDLYQKMSRTDEGIIEGIIATMKILSIKEK